MAVATVPAPRDIYQLKVTLSDVKAPIWRRVLVSCDFTLAQLHTVLQAAMGWEDCHLHEFRIAGLTIGAPDPDAPRTLINEKKVRLLDVLGKVGAKGVYTYDFGDGWDHNIVVEKIMKAEPGVAYPVCVTGKRRGPPEDSGGPFGYENLLEVLGDPKHEEHKTMHEWIGNDFDPEVFSVDDVNRRLALLQRRFAKSRLGWFGIQHQNTFQHCYLAKHLVGYNKFIEEPFTQKLARNCELKSVKSSQAMRVAVPRDELFRGCKVTGCHAAHFDFPIGDIGHEPLALYFRFFDGEKSASNLHPAHRLNSTKLRREIRISRPGSAKRRSTSEELASGW